MPRSDYAICRACGGHRSEVGSLSRSRLCENCADVIEKENWSGLTSKSGPAFVRWRRSMAACVGGVLLDDVKPKP